MSSRRKKIWIRIGLAFLGLLVIAGILFSVYVYPFLKFINTVKTVQYDKDLTLIIGGGGNSGILVSDSLVLVIDTKMSDDAANDQYNKAKQLAGSKPIIVVNTHNHPDHISGNKLYKGCTIIAGGNYNPEEWKKDNGEEGIPTTWLKDSIVLKLGNERVVVLNIGKNAHTASDVVVYLQNRKMLFGGDLILNKQNPILMSANHSDADGYLYAFDMVSKRWDIKNIVPGHGDIGGIEVLTTFQQYFNDMKTAAADDSKKSELKSKYSDWRQLPFMMSPGATISYIKSEKKAQ